MTKRDLEEDLRLNAGATTAKDIKEAVLERNGDISVMRKPQVFTVAVQACVQTVRIQIEG